MTRGFSTSREDLESGWDAELEKLEQGGVHLTMSKLTELQGGAHTPTPWRVDGPDFFGDFNILHSGDSLAVGAVVSNMRPPAEVAANAAFIVQAVNSHAALVEALTEARAFADNELCARETSCAEDGEEDIICNGKTYVGEARDLVAKIDAALTLANGGGE